MRIRIAMLAALVTLAVAPAVVQAQLPATIQTTVPPGGNSSIGSPTLAKDMTSMNVDIQPGNPNDDFFAEMQVVLSLQPTPGKRLLTCIGLYINVAHGIDESADLQFPETVHPLAVLLLSACLEQMAQLNRAAQTSASSSAVASGAAAACNRLATQVGATYTRVGRGKYRATIDGTVTRLKQRSRLKVTCRRKGAGMTLKVAPRTKGTSLRSVVGPRLRLGLYNPLESSGSSTVKLTFRR
jgi:hypothetical protein